MHLDTNQKDKKRNNTLSSQNSSSISANQTTPTKSNRSKMYVLTEKNNQQFYIHLEMNLVLEK